MVIRSAPRRASPSRWPSSSSATSSSLTPLLAASSLSTTTRMSSASLRFQLNSSPFQTAKSHHNVLFIPLVHRFFCAIPPTLRADWGRRMAEIIPKDGILITLMYPIGNHTDGPPFAVSVDNYHFFLDANFDCLIVDECSSFEARQGKEKIGVWRRR